MSKTKKCPRCGEDVLERRPVCRKCDYRFPMSCEGCGREVVGRVFCKECAESGYYHHNRAESLPSIRPEEKNVEKFVWNMLKDAK